jgi:hypothetical protein
VRSARLAVEAHGGASDNAHVPPDDQIPESQLALKCGRPKQFALRVLLFYHKMVEHRTCDVHFVDLSEAFLSPLRDDCDPFLSSSPLESFVDGVCFSQILNCSLQRANRFVVQTQ